MRPPFTLEVAFTSGLRNAATAAAAESAAKRQAAAVLGSAAREALAAKRRDFQQRYETAPRTASVLYVIH